MWWFKTLAALLIAVTVTGCGFRPLYGKHSTAPTLQELSLVYVDTIKDRRGQMLRNRLLTLMNPKGISAKPRYQLSTSLKESIHEQLKREDETTTNADLRLIATFALLDLRSGYTLVSGNSKATSSYDLVNSAAYKLAAERDARRKAIRMLADDIKARIASYLLNPVKPKKKLEIDPRTLYFHMHPIFLSHKHRTIHHLPTKYPDQM